MIIRQKCININFHKNKPHQATLTHCVIDLLDCLQYTWAELTNCVCFYTMVLLAAHFYFCKFIQQSVHILLFLTNALKGISIAVST